MFVNCGWIDEARVKNRKRDNVELVVKGVVL